MAEIHARSMSVPPPWTAPTMASLRSAAGAIFVSKERAFALGRVIEDEAELLTLAVDPVFQGNGLGRACLRDFLRASQSAGARRVFLEVAANNPAARALYVSEGFAEDGHRKNYYRLDKANSVDAILMSKRLKSN